MNAHTLFGRRTTPTGRTVLAACGLAGLGLTGLGLAGCAANVSTAGTEVPASAAVASSPGTTADLPGRVPVGDRLAGRLQQAKVALADLAGGRGRHAEPGELDPFRQEPHFTALADAGQATGATPETAAKLETGVVQTAGVAAGQPAAGVPAPPDDAGARPAPRLESVAAAATPAAAAAVPAWVREPNPFDRQTVEKFTIASTANTPPVAQNANVRTVSIEMQPLLAGKVSANCDRASDVLCAPDENPFAAYERAQRQAAGVQAVQYERPAQPSSHPPERQEPLPPGRPLGSADPFGRPSSFGPARPASAATLGDSQPLGVPTYLTSQGGTGTAPSGDATAGANRRMAVNEQMIVDLDRLPKRPKLPAASDPAAPTAAEPATTPDGYPITPRQSFGPPAWLGGDDAPAVATANQPTTLRPLSPARERVTVASVAGPAAAREPALPLLTLPPLPPAAADSDPFANFETLHDGSGPELAAISAPVLTPAASGGEPRMLELAPQPPAALGPPAAARRTRLQDYSDDGTVQPICVAPPATPPQAEPLLRRIGTRPLIALGVLLSMVAAVWMRRRFA